ncbi:50S ribosomal protein L3 [Candidatus Poribacteria bacterium]|nr:50S ribosomal protein L3 [Candidatus Poribacteria bacterium]
MSEGIIGKKLGMTRVFEASGAAVAVTVIEAGPCPVVQTKSAAKEGYDAVQLGFGRQKRANRPTAGHFKKAGVAPTSELREFRSEEASRFEVGQEVTIGDLFAEGDLVDVTGITKGRGFAGHVKRWGFRGGKKSHGGEKDLRRPGSIGTSAWPSRVVKGRKMAGHMGNSNVTVQNLTVVKTDTERHLLVVKGAVPGPKNGLVVIRRAAKPDSHR